MNCWKLIFCMKTFVKKQQFFDKQVNCELELEIELLSSWSSLSKKVFGILALEQVISLSLSLSLSLLPIIFSTCVKTLHTQVSYSHLSLTPTTTTTTATKPERMTPVLMMASCRINISSSSIIFFYCRANTERAQKCRRKSPLLYPMLPMFKCAHWNVSVCVCLANVE